MGRSILDGPIGFEVFPDRRNSRISLKKLLVVYTGLARDAGTNSKTGARQRKDIYEGRSPRPVVNRSGILRPCATHATNSRET